METWKIILGSGVAVAIITAIKEGILWIANRKAHNQDKKEEKDDCFAALKQSVEDGFKLVNGKIELISEDVKTIHESISEINKKQDDQCEALQAQLGNTIKYLAGKYIRRGKITPEELEELEWLFIPYEKNGGNGTRAKMFHKCQTSLELVDSVPAKSKGEIQ